MLCFGRCVSCVRYVSSVLAFLSSGAVGWKKFSKSRWGKKLQFFNSRCKFSITFRQNIAHFATVFFFLKMRVFGSKFCTSGQKFTDNKKIYRQFPTAQNWGAGRAIRPTDAPIPRRQWKPRSRRVQSDVAELNWHGLVFDKLTNG